MKLSLRRKPAEPTGRRRPRPSAPSSAYRSNQTEPNIGRKLNVGVAKAGNYWLQRFGLAVLVLAALVSAINVLTLSSSAKIIPVDTGDRLPRSRSVYEETAGRLLAESVWNRNKITIDTGEIRQGMLAKYPELENVRVSLPLLSHRPLIYLEAAHPAVVLVNTGGAFVLADSGKVLFKAANQAEVNRPDLPAVNDQSGLPLSLNHQGLPANQVDFIRIVTAQLAAKQFKVESMTLPASASQLEVKPAGQSYVIRFNLQNNTARRQAGTFLATIEQLKKQNITPTEYIDVRVDGRAYYK